MRKKRLALRVLFGAAALAGCMAPVLAASTPQQDRQALREYFHKRFPKVAMDDFVNGPYALNADMRAQWKQIMEFPPFSFAVSNGQSLFEQPLPDGTTYAKCMPGGGVDTRQNYPYFDEKTGQVVTQVSQINMCRVEHGAKPLNPLGDDMAALDAYLASTSDGKPFDVKIPDDPRALAAYNKGKEYFYTRRGQLNFSCASCHVQEAGRHLRTQVLTPALGMVASFPVYRSKWGAVGTLDRRIRGCNVMVRALPLKAQSETYRDLEYFLTYMSNGLPVAGPGARP